MPEEKLFPASIYVSISGLGGIIASRGLISKMTFPLLFASISSLYFLPKTSEKITFRLIDSVYNPADRVEHAKAVKKALNVPVEYVDTLTQTVTKGISDISQTLKDVKK